MNDAVSGVTTRAARKRSALATITNAAASTSSNLRQAKRATRNSPAQSPDVIDLTEEGVVVKPLKPWERLQFVKNVAELSLASACAPEYGPITQLVPDILIHKRAMEVISFVALAGGRGVGHDAPLFRDFTFEI